MTSESARATVAVTIPTFKRPKQLKRLLATMPEQRSEAERDHRISTVLLVVDNDPAGSAHETATESGATYIAEPRLGLAAVRNAALSAAFAAGADAIVFIDDDELPHASWLTTLVGRWLRGDAEIVSGRVVSTFDYPLDPWIEAGGFFRRVEFADDAAMRFAPTNNLLLDVGFLQTHDLWFDADFALSGGEDIRLTSQALALGARIRAVPDALVTDPVPATRATRAWVLRRAFRVGTTTARCGVLLRPSAAGRLVERLAWLTRGITRVGVGSLRLLLGLLSRSVSHRARAARQIARGTGMCAGAFGTQYREYQARHTVKTG